MFYIFLYLIYQKHTKISRNKEEYKQKLKYIFYLFSKQRLTFSVHLYLTKRLSLRMKIYNAKTSEFHALVSAGSATNFFAKR